jgi:hypothetical protein
MCGRIATKNMIGVMIMSLLDQMTRIVFVSEMVVISVICDHKSDWMTSVVSSHFLQ